VKVEKGISAGTGKYSKSLFLSLLDVLEDEDLDWWSAASIFRVIA